MISVTNFIIKMQLVFGYAVMLVVRTSVLWIPGWSGQNFGLKKSEFARV